MIGHKVCNNKRSGKTVLQICGSILLLLVIIIIIIIIPPSKEPSGLVRTDGKRPDGCTLIPWCTVRALTWDDTVACTVADSYIHDSSRTPGAVAELAATRKRSSTPC